MSPVFITAIQFSKCASLTRGNFIVPYFIPFVKHFFHFFAGLTFRGFPSPADLFILSHLFPFVKHFFRLFLFFYFFHAIAEFSAPAFIFSYIII